MQVSACRITIASLLAMGVVTTAASSFAADLAHQSPLGQVFAERPRVIIRGRQEPEPQRAEIILPIGPRTPGYYGRPGDYAYRSYYGTSPIEIFTRLPYACGWHGLC